MLLDGIATGALTRSQRILDATSGNTGIAFAMFGAVLGYGVTLYLPANCSPERKQTMKIFGAEVIETDPLEGSDGAFLAAQAAAQDTDRYFYPNQYNNPANPRAHYETTAVEIWDQSNGAVTHFIASMGTSGTFMGTARRLKDFNPGIATIAVQPDSPFHGIEGTKHMASTIKPGFLDFSLADDIVTISTREAYAMTRQLAREEGLFVGVSAGANVAAAVSLAKTLPQGSVVVTVLCDSGARYLSEEFWEAE
jgi:cysteine synthase B